MGCRICQLQPNPPEVLETRSTRSSAFLPDSATTTGSCWSRCPRRRCRRASPALGCSRARERALWRGVGTQGKKGGGGAEAGGDTPSPPLAQPPPPLCLAPSSLHRHPPATHRRDPPLRPRWATPDSPSKPSAPRRETLEDLGVWGEAAAVSHGSGGGVGSTREKMGRADPHGPGNGKGGSTFLCSSSPTRVCQPESKGGGEKRAPGKFIGEKPGT